MRQPLASATLKHVLAIPCHCPSVRLSVTRWYCIKTAQHIVMLFSPHDSPFILVLCVLRFSRNYDWVTPAGPLNRDGVWKCRNFRPITCYISETVEDRWVYTARFTSIESSFQPYDIYRDCLRDVTRGKQNVVKTLIHFTRLLKINHSTDISLYLINGWT